MKFWFTWSKLAKKTASARFESSRKLGRCQHAARESCRVNLGISVQSVKMDMGFAWCYCIHGCCYYCLRCAPRAFVVANDMQIKFPLRMFIWIWCRCSSKQLIDLQTTAYQQNIDDAHFQFLLIAFLQTRMKFVVMRELHNFWMMTAEGWLNKRIDSELIAFGVTFVARFDYRGRFVDAGEMHVYLFFRILPRLTSSSTICTGMKYKSEHKFIKKSTKHSINKY